jgi:hypothetical protein
MSKIKTKIIVIFNSGICLSVQGLVYFQVLIILNLTKIKGTDGLITPPRSYATPSERTFSKSPTEVDQI